MHRTGCRCNLCWLACCKGFWDGKDDWDIGKSCLETSTAIKLIWKYAIINSNMEEEIKGVITRVEAGFVSSTYSLYFTNKRIIRALTFSAGKKIGTFAMGGKLLGGTINKHFENKKAGNLINLKPDEILNENKKNIEIPYSSINRIEIKTPRSIKSMGLKVIKMKIVTSDKEYEMKIKENEQFDSSLELIKSVLPDKLELK